jgi:polyphenol oxidase
VPVASRKTQLSILQADSLSRIPWLIHGFSTRTGGFSRPYGGNVLNLGFTKQDTRAAVERNRKEFLRKLGAQRGQKSWPLVALRQIHSDLIHCISGMPVETPAGDGLITATPRLLLAIQAADCLPVILVDKKTHAVGVIHAGFNSLASFSNFSLSSPSPATL